MIKNVKRIRKLTLLSHLAIVCFIFFFLKFVEGNAYIYEKCSIKNTETIAVNLIFSVLLIIHYTFIIINLLIILQGIAIKQLNLSDILWSLYPMLLLLVISGFDISNLLNFIKAPFNIIADYLSV